MACINYMYEIYYTNDLILGRSSPNVSHARTILGEDYQIVSVRLHTASNGELLEKVDPGLLSRTDNSTKMARKSEKR